MFTSEKNVLFTALSTALKGTSCPFSLVSTLPGTFHAGAFGWFIFLKPLPPGDHTVFYNVRVTPTGALTSPGTTANFADITYLLHVK